MGPLSYVYGYRGGVGRRGVGQDTTRDDGIKIRARDGRYELVLWRCAAGFVPKSAIWTMGRCGSTENGRSGGRKLAMAAAAAGSGGNGSSVGNRGSGSGAPKSISII